MKNLSLKTGIKPYIVAREAVSIQPNTELYINFIFQTLLCFIDVAQLYYICKLFSDEPFHG